MCIAVSRLIVLILYRIQDGKKELTSQALEKCITPTDTSWTIVVHLACMSDAYPIEEDEPYKE